MCVSFYLVCFIVAIHFRILCVLALACVKGGLSLYNLFYNSFLRTSLMHTHTHTRTPTHTHTPPSQVHPLFMLSVADFILSILWMIGGIVWLSPGEGGWASSESDSHAGMCYVLAIATTVSVGKYLVSPLCMQ